MNLESVPQNMANAVLRDLLSRQVALPWALNHYSNSTFWAVTFESEQFLTLLAPNQEGDKQMGSENDHLGSCNACGLLPGKFGIISMKFRL